MANSNEGIYYSQNPSPMRTFHSTFQRPTYPVHSLRLPGWDTSAPLHLVLLHLPCLMSSTTQLQATP